jgi:hypothetical protein
MSTRLKAVYAVVSQERLGRPAYRRIGTGFANRDGSISVVLDAFPVSGRLHITDVELNDSQAQHASVQPAVRSPQTIALRQTQS